MLFKSQLPVYFQSSLCKKIFHTSTTHVCSVATRPSAVIASLRRDIGVSVYERLLRSFWSVGSGRPWADVLRHLAALSCIHCCTLKLIFTSYFLLIPITQNWGF